jgi:hypothetical protein
MCDQGCAFFTVFEEENSSPVYLRFLSYITLIIKVVIS